MALVSTTRRYTFQSVHALLEGAHRERLHGHRFDLEISFRDSKIYQVDQVVQEHVINRLHAQDLSHVVNPATGEILVEWIDQRLRARLPDLIGVCLQETRKNRFVSAASEDRFV